MHDVWGHGLRHVADDCTTFDRDRQSTRVSGQDLQSQPSRRISLYRFSRPPLTIFFLSRAAVSIAHARTLTQDRSRSFLRSSTDRPGRPHPALPFPCAWSAYGKRPATPFGRPAVDIPQPADNTRTVLPLSGHRRLPTDHDGGADVAARAFSACYPDDPSPQQ